MLAAASLLLELGYLIVLYIGDGPCPDVIADLDRAECTTLLSIYPEGAPLSGRASHGSRAVYEVSSSDSRKWTVGASSPIDQAAILRRVQAAVDASPQSTTAGRTVILS